MRDESKPYERKGHSRVFSEVESRESRNEGEESRESSPSSPRLQAATRRRLPTPNPRKRKRPHLNSEVVTEIEKEAIEALLLLSRSTPAKVEDRVGGLIEKQAKRKRTRVHYRIGGGGRRKRQWPGTEEKAEAKVDRSGEMRVDRMEGSYSSETRDYCSSGAIDEAFGAGGSVFHRRRLGWRTTQSCFVFDLNEIAEMGA